MFPSRFYLKRKTQVKTGGWKNACSQINPSSLRHTSGEWTANIFFKAQVRQLISSRSLHLCCWHGKVCCNFSVVMSPTTDAEWMKTSTHRATDQIQLKTVSIFHSLQILELLVPFRLWVRHVVLVKTPWSHNYTMSQLLPVSDPKCCHQRKTEAISMLDTGV